MEIIEELNRKVFLWFQDHRNIQTGLVLDRGFNKNFSVKTNISSISATGYYLSLLPEFVRLGYLNYDDARKQAKITINFVKEIKDYNGFLPHFIDVETGENLNSEISSLDSSIFFNGCIVVCQAFSFKDNIVNRCDWKSLLNDGLLSYGWKNGKKLECMHLRNSEFAIVYFLAIGSEIENDVWYNTKIIKTFDFPLFVFYYGLGWHDLKGEKDKEGVELEETIKKAIKYNKKFNVNGWWGISAGDTPNGYKACCPSDTDGTIFPYSSLACLPWTKINLKKWQSTETWDLIYKDYGLSSFNGNWVSDDLIGIDLGSFAVNLANYRNNTIRKLWMENSIAKKAIKKIYERK